MAKDFLNDLMKDIGSKYPYGNGSFSLKTEDLGEFDQVALVIDVESVSGTDSTFKVETSIDDIVYVAVDHPDLTDGVLTITNASESHNFQFQDFPYKHIKVTFNPATSNGVVNSIKALAKQ